MQLMRQRNFGKKKRFRCRISCECIYTAYTCTNYDAIRTQSVGLFCQNHTRLQIAKKVLTFVARYDNIIKLSRETQVKRKTENLENCIIRQCEWGNFGEFTENFDRSVSLLKKISKNFEKST